MSMADEIKKALEPMTQEITELTEKVDQLALHVAELEAKQDALEKQIAAGLPAISEIKSAGAEAVAPLKQIANEIKDDLKKAGAEAVQQIKATKKAQDDDETDWKSVIKRVIVCFIIAAFLVSLSFVGARKGLLDNHVSNNVQRILFNQVYNPEGQPYPIKYFESEEEATKKITNQQKYEMNLVKNQQQQPQAAE